MKTVLVTGARDYVDEQLIKEWFGKFTDKFGPAKLIHGDCRGVDKFAAETARELKWTIRAFPADWDNYGRAAGPKRNAQMVDQLPDYICAFHPTPAKSRGTKSCMMIAHEKLSGRQCKVYVNNKRCTWNGVLELFK